MPPKNTAANDALDAASVKFMLSALKSCSEFAPDWNAVAKEHDIKYAKNARPRFNTIVAKFGFKLEDKKIVQIDQDPTDGSGTAVSKLKKTATAPRTGKRKLAKPLASNKRPRFEEEEEDGDDEVIQVKEESEDDASEDGNGGPATI